MKKIILTAVVALAAMTANAQVWVGGGLGFSHTDYDDAAFEPNETSFYIVPEIGYSLNDKWDLAIAIGDKYTKVEKADAVNDFYVNPYARYTFYKTGKVGFFVDGGFEVQAGDSPTEWGIGLRPGVKFAASDKVTFVATFGNLGYRNVEDNYSQFGFDFDGRGLTFGCYYSF